MLGVLGVVASASLAAYVCIRLSGPLGDEGDVDVRSGGSTSRSTSPPPQLRASLAPARSAPGSALAPVSEVLGGEEWIRAAPAPVESEWPLLRRDCPWFDVAAGGAASPESTVLMHGLGDPVLAVPPYRGSLVLGPTDRAWIEGVVAEFGLACARLPALTQPATRAQLETRHDEIERIRGEYQSVIASVAVRRVEESPTARAALSDQRPVRMIRDMSEASRLSALIGMCVHAGMLETGPLTAEHLEWLSAADLPQLARDRQRILELQSGISRRPDDEVSRVVRDALRDDAARWMAEIMRRYPEAGRATGSDPR